MKNVYFIQEKTLNLKKTLILEKKLWESFWKNWGCLFSYFCKFTHFYLKTMWQSLFKNQKKSLIFWPGLVTFF